MCGRGRVCGGANILVRACVCACACVLLPVPGALMLYILYVEHTLGEVKATMGRCTSRWPP